MMSYDPVTGLTFFRSKATSTATTMKADLVACNRPAAIIPRLVRWFR